MPAYITPPRAVLFDLDGTLTDTLRDLGGCTDRVLAAHGFPPHTPEEYRHFVGDGIQKLIERALGEAAAPALTAELLAEFRVLYDRECLHYVSLYPGIADAVRALRDAGIRLAVVTNKPEPQAQKIVAHLFPSDTFDAVYGNVDGRPRKPDRTVVDLALDTLGVRRENAVFVGDSDVDVLTAHGAGLPCIGCAWGFRGEAELVSAGADILVRSAGELIDSIFKKFVVQNRQARIDKPSKI